ncbi:probable proton-coupled zinc antiporter SLC30A3 isoform X2 [Hemicordylus capensis]|uniref:probable proton-coupled zinc antiporter SLC30A3 isoform X2 n=1 Tax=Hemicordylus capensis TaxID=884348 RepID=UPI0023049229|nr:probable proton-coupled zinc antiporter SLC30A3 isoform X2 [Hemicordylus capensis]
MARGPRPWKPPGQGLGLFAGPRDAFPGLPPEKGHAEVPVDLEMEHRLAPHCHLSSPCFPSPSQQKLQAQRKLRIACLVCLLFMIGEVIGGYLAHSLAIMTDAAHLLTDMGSMGVSLFSLWISTRPATKTMTFGWHRSETLGALASVLSIWIVTGVLVYLASARIINNDYEIEASAMLGTSACAVGVNILMACLLHESGSPHGHGLGTGGYERIGDSPCSSPPPARSNTSVRAAFVHVVGDLLQSFGVFVAATVIYFKPQYKIADPISTFLFSLFVLVSTLTILRDVFRVLMEGAPRGMAFQAVKELLLSIKGVKGVHSLHLWALTLSHHMVAVHLAIESGADMEAVLQEATALLQSKFGFLSCTVQVERYLEDMAVCRQCQEPRN